MQDLVLRRDYFEDRLCIFFLHLLGDLQRKNINEGILL